MKDPCVKIRDVVVNGSTIGQARNITEARRMIAVSLGEDPRQRKTVAKLVGNGSRQLEFTV